MNILMIVENYYPHIGGVEVIFKNLAEGLVADGNNVKVITHRMKGAKKREVINGVEIIRISCRESRYIFSFAAIARSIKEARWADVIHTTTFNGAFPAWIASKIGKKKAVITVHEVWRGKWREYANKTGLDAFFHELAERFLYMFTFDQYVSVSNSTKSQLQNIGKKNVVTIYNSVDYEHFNSRKLNRTKLRKQFGFDKKFVCLTLGRPGGSKGIEYAIEAVPQVETKHYQHVFILSKDRQYLTKHRSLAGLMQNLKQQHIMKLLDPVSHTDLPKYMYAADCIVIPSLSEGFGYVAAEAAALGVPMIVTNTTSLPEVVSGKHIFVKTRSSRAIADAIDAVAQKKYQKSPLKKFVTAQNIRSYRKIYEKLLRSSKKQ